MGEVTSPRYPTTPRLDLEDLSFTIKVVIPCLNSSFLFFFGEAWQLWGMHVEAGLCAAFGLTIPNATL
jgi:hypothetical protein